MTYVVVIVVCCFIAFAIVSLSKRKDGFVQNDVDVIPQGQKPIDTREVEIQVKATHQKQSRQNTPTPINIEDLDYVPLPPSPSRWKADKNSEELCSTNGLFELRDSSMCRLSEPVRLTNEQKPDTFYKRIRFTADGILYIDPTGKNPNFPNCRASLQKRDRDGRIVAEVPLEHDIYRIGTNPTRTDICFMSTTGMVHSYGGNLEKLFIYDLSSDVRVKQYFKSTLSTWGTMKSHLRNVDIAPDGKKFIFTIADNAWSLDSGNSPIWGISMPLNEGWSRRLTRIVSESPREEVLNSMSVLDLGMPVTEGEIRRKYREMALKWHPDRNRAPGSEEKMKQINLAFEVLTGVDPNSLEVFEREVFTYEKRADYDVEVEGMVLSFTFQTGNPNDWVYALGYSVDGRCSYLGTYSGKIIRIDAEGKPTKVFDVANVPRWIVDTGDYLYFLTDTRLYILSECDSLVNLIDVHRKEELVLGDTRFGLLGNKSLRWFNEDGNALATLTTKHPIRVVYTNHQGAVVETRQHRTLLFEA